MASANVSSETHGASARRERECAYHAGCGSRVVISTARPRLCAFLGRCVRVYKYQISYMLIHCSGELSRIARHHVWTALVLAVARTAAMAAHEAAIVLQVASICPCRPLFKMMGTAAQTTHAVNARIKKTPPYATCLARLTSPCSPASAAAAAAAAPGGTAHSPRRASPAGWARCRSSP